MSNICSIINRLSTARLYTADMTFKQHSRSLVMEWCYSIQSGMIAYSLYILTISQSTMSHYYVSITCKLSLINMKYAQHNYVL